MTFAPFFDHSSVLPNNHPMRTASGKIMGQSGQENGQFGLLSAQTVSERANSYFRAQFPRDTAKSVAQATGIPAPTVAKWLTRSSAPSAGHLVACWIAFGPGFLSALCPGVEWVEMATAWSRREAADRQIAEAEAQLATLRTGRRA